MQWKPIDNLPQNWSELANTELPPLVTVWMEQAERLRNSGEFKLYMEKLIREIAIETGIIERLYSLDRGITRLLIENGIDEALIPHGTTDQPIKKVIALIRDQEEAVEQLFDHVKGNRSLSSFYIRQLHELLTRNQETTEAVNTLGQLFEVSLRRGQWKLHPNNPQRRDGTLHEYAPPEQVDSEMDQLIAWHLEHEEENVSPEIEAAWLHHRFTQIHPFQDGNGRVARCLASLVFIKAGWFPLVLTRDDRGTYIESLEKAVRGNLLPLIALFSKSQKQAFIRSLGLSEQILAENRRTQTVISSIAEKLKNQTETAESNIKIVEAYAKVLNEIVANRLESVAEEIKLSLQGLVEAPKIFTVNALTGDEKSHYYYFQVVETAKQLDYYANLRSYHSWSQIVLDVGRPTMILFSFHVLGYEQRGLLACSACAYHRDDTENGDRSVNEVQALVDAPFQFSYADNEEILIERFEQWAEDAILTGLNYWNNSL